MTDATQADPYSLGDWIDQHPPEQQLSEAERVYCDAFQEWMEIGGRDSGARTLGAHLHLRIAEHVRRQAAAEINAVADRRTGTIRSAMLMVSELITPGSTTRRVEQRRGTIAPER